jgi:Ca2+-binding RTX toxin-like protein
VKPGPNAGDIEVKIVVKGGGAESTVVFPAGFGRVVVDGAGGDDDIKVFSGVTMGVDLFGGAGNDMIRGGDGPDILVGGDGNDMLAGNGGRDILIGGLGADKLLGEDDDDILVGGVYVDENNRFALAALLEEWTSANAYADRVINLSVGVGAALWALNETTVFDDGVTDKLSGKSGLDLFLANSNDDKLDVDDMEEMLTEIEMLFVTSN